MVKQNFGMIMNLNEKCLLKFLQLPDELLLQTEIMLQFLKEVEDENEQYKS